MTDVMMRIIENYQHIVTNGRLGRHGFIYVGRKVVPIVHGCQFNGECYTDIEDPLQGYYLVRREFTVDRRGHHRDCVNIYDVKTRIMYIVQPCNKPGMNYVTVGKIKSVHQSNDQSGKFYITLESQMYLINRDIITNTIGEDYDSTSVTVVTDNKCNTVTFYSEGVMR